MSSWTVGGVCGVLTPVIKDQSGKKYTMDDYQIRNPTNVTDVARVLYDLARELDCTLLTQTLRRPTSRRSTTSARWAPR